METSQPIISTLTSISSKGTFSTSLINFYVQIVEHLLRTNVIIEIGCSKKNRQSNLEKNSITYGKHDFSSLEISVILFRITNDNRIS